jgi:hypothetical protein
MYILLSNRFFREAYMRKLFLIISLISILALAGCSVFNGGSTNGTTTTTPPSPKILRQTQLAGKYQMYQIEVTLKAGAELPLIIKLQNGEKADGYFYVEKGGDSIDFQITGNSQVYQSDMKNIPSGQAASDRFAFTATQAQGLYYELTLRNTASSGQNTSSTIFVEVIYSGSEPISAPLGK